MNIQSVSQLSTIPSVQDDFKRLTETLSDLLRREGLYRKPYTTARLPYFSALTSAERERVVATLRDYVEVCLECSASGESLKDTPTLAWRMFRRLGMNPTAEAFSKVDDRHIIELYSHDNIQIFRNFRFFEICSYSFEELFCRPWWQLFRREDAVTQLVFKYAVGVLSGQIQGTDAPDIGTHLLEEIASPLRFRMNVDIDYFAPMYSNGEVAAIFVVERAELIDAPLKDLAATKKSLTEYYELNPAEMN